MYSDHPNGGVSSHGKLGKRESKHQHGGDHNELQDIVFYVFQKNPSFFQ